MRDPRKLYRLARQRDLDVTQAMAFEALKADVGRQAREQERQDGRPGHQARRAGADRGRQELRGHDRPGHTLDRELPAEAVHQTKRPKDCNATAVVDRVGTPKL